MFWDNNESIEHQTRNVANEIKNEMKLIQVDKAAYPSPSNFCSDIDYLIPPTLQSLLEIVISDNRHSKTSYPDVSYNDRRKKKIDSICHDIALRKLYNCDNDII